MTTLTGDDLTHAADEARARLLDTVVHLNERRRDALGIPKEIGGLVKRFGLAAGVLATAGVAALVVHAISSHDSRRARARNRWKLLKNAWNHPDRELRAERRPFGIEVLRSLVLTVVTSALAIPLRRTVQAVDSGSSGRPTPTAKKTLPAH